MPSFSPLNLSGLICIRPDIATDQRGFFMETYHADRFRAAGIAEAFVQDNHSRSTRGVLRGLHFQVRHPQGKLVRVVSGQVFDVAVDLRRSSPTFGRWDGLILSAENKLQLWIPAGFAHGFLVLSESAEVVYKVTDYYDPGGERTILWNDPDLGVEWPIPTGEKPVVSEKDSRGTPFRAAELYD